MDIKFEESVSSAFEIDECAPLSQHHQNDQNLNSGSISLLFVGKREKQVYAFKRLHTLSAHSTILHTKRNFIEIIPSTGGELLCWLAASERLRCITCLHTFPASWREAPVSIEALGRGRIRSRHS